MCTFMWLSPKYFYTLLWSNPFWKNSTRHEPYFCLKFSIAPGNNGITRIRLMFIIQRYMQWFIHWVVHSVNMYGNTKSICLNTYIKVCCYITRDNISQGWNISLSWNRVLIYLKSQQQSYFLGFQVHCSIASLWPGHLYLV